MTKWPRTFTALVFLVALLASGCSFDGGDNDAASFEIDGDQAIMTGVIGSNTPDTLAAMLEANPDVTTIILQDVPGSEDDEANLIASRMISDAGLATHVPADGFIASGGVDFFLAGAARSWNDGATIAVHSWATGDGIEGKDVPRDDPQHRLYLDYYEEIGIDEEFYWFTLEAAPAASVHNMTEAELARYGFATE